MKDNFPKDTSKLKLVVCDFDRTLADANLNISQKVSDVVKKWQNSGKLFSIASGRTHLMLKDRCTNIELQTPIIGCGGAEIVDLKSLNKLFYRTIDKEAVGYIVGILEKYKLKAVIEIDDIVYSDYYANDYFPSLTFKPMSEFKIQKAPKIVVFLDEDEGSNESNIINDEIIKKFPSLNVAESVSYRGRNWDITSIEATKNIAMVELMKILGLTRDQVVGVGDGYNDFPLLEACGYKVAMGNAVDELKSIADIVVPSVEEDGVAYLIDKLLGNS